MSCLFSRLSECNENVSNEQLIQNSFSKRIEAVLYEKCQAEAKTVSNVLEVRYPF